MRAIASSVMVLSALGLSLSCGGGTPSMPAATTPVAAAGQAPAPSPTPTPTPAPAAPPPTPSPTAPPQINHNDRPLDHLRPGGHHVHCNGEIQPHSQNPKETAGGHPPHP